MYIWKEHIERFYISDLARKKRIIGFKNLNIIKYLHIIFETKWELYSKLLRVLRCRPNFCDVLLKSHLC